MSKLNHKDMNAKGIAHAIPIRRGTKRKRKDNAFSGNKRAKNSSQPQPQHSALEQLPNEILEQIFLETRSLDLVRAAPKLAVRLSHPSIYKAFCERIFHHVDVVQCIPPPGLSQTRFRLALASDDHENKKLDRIQRQTLECRWMTFEFFSNHIKETEERGRKTFEKGLSLAGYSREHNESKVFDVYFAPGRTKRLLLPRKLFKIPPIDRVDEFLELLSSLGPKVNFEPGSYEEEGVVDLWKYAIRTKKLPLLIILSNIGRFPKTVMNEDLLVFAMSNTSFDALVMYTVFHWSATMDASWMLHPKVVTTLEHFGLELSNQDADMLDITLKKSVWIVWALRLEALDHQLKVTFDPILEQLLSHDSCDFGIFKTSEIDNSTREILENYEKFHTDREQIWKRK